MTYLYGAASEVQASEWVHWAGTYDGTTMALYINGAQVHHHRRRRRLLAVHRPLFRKLLLPKYLCPTLC